MTREIIVSRINTQKSSVATFGLQGPQGSQGAQGVEGGFGASTLYYNFSTATTNADPGVGFLKFNNANIKLATSLYIDDQDKFSTDVQTFLRTVDDSTSTLKGHFKISNRLDPSDFAIFSISAIAENTGYFTVTCAHVSGASSSFSNNEEVTITFARTGDIGPQGAQGDQGAQGVQGVANSVVASVTLGISYTAAPTTYTFLTGMETDTFTATSGRKYLINVSFNLLKSGGTGTDRLSFALYRDTTQIVQLAEHWIAANEYSAYSYTYLWAPVSTFSNIKMRLYGKTSSVVPDSFTIRSGVAAQIVVLDLGT